MDKLNIQKEQNESQSDITNDRTGRVRVVAMKILDCAAIVKNVLATSLKLWQGFSQALWKITKDERLIFDSTRRWGFCKYYAYIY